MMQTHELYAAVYDLAVTSRASSRPEPEIPTPAPDLPPPAPAEVPSLPFEVPPDAVPEIPSPSRIVAMSFCEPRS